MPKKTPKPTLSITFIHNDQREETIEALEEMSMPSMPSMPSVPGARDDEDEEELDEDIEIEEAILAALLEDDDTFVDPCPAGESLGAALANGAEARLFCSLIPNDFVLSHQAFEVVAVCCCVAMERGGLNMCPASKQACASMVSNAAPRWRITMRTAGLIWSSPKTDPSTACSATPTPSPGCA